MGDLDVEVSGTNMSALAALVGPVTVAYLVNRSWIGRWLALALATLGGPLLAGGLGTIADIIVEDDHLTSLAVVFSLGPQAFVSLLMLFFGRKA